jgi:hypothetical protein
MPQTISAVESKATPHEFISRSTILILSGFLAGLGTSRGLDPGVQMRVFCSAGVGFLAYVALDILARRRRNSADREAQNRASRKLERRIGRHVGRATVAAQDLPMLESPQRDPVLSAIMARQDF